MSQVRAWPYEDLVAVVADIDDELSRCPGCRMTDDEKWLVAAEAEQCPACEHRDRKHASIDGKHRAGWFVRFRPVADPVTESSPALYTAEGLAVRKRVIRDRRRAR